MDPNWTELLGRVMAALNKSSGDHLVEVPPYKSVFGMEYDPPLSCSMEEMRGCKTIQDRLALVPDEHLETFAKNTGDLCTPTKEEEEEDANAPIRKRLFEKNIWDWEADDAHETDPQDVVTSTNEGMMQKHKSEKDSEKASDSSDVKTKVDVADQLGSTVAV